MKIARTTALVITLSAAACAVPPPGSVVVDSPTNLPPIQQVYANQLSRVATGMSLAEFRAVFPSAYVIGENDNLTAYEVSLTQRYVTQRDMELQNFRYGVGSPSAREHQLVLWFYFYDDKLVRWGRPQDWPPNPNIVIEQR